jgi:hypothetical protein
MPLFEDLDRGDPDEWVELNTEEKRCLLGLQNYYMKIEDEDVQTSMTMAWDDLKTEFERLIPFQWYK